MKLSTVIILGLLGLTACDSKWKPFDNQNGLLAEPAGLFEESTGVFIEINCDGSKNISKRIFDASLKGGDQIVRTQYFESNERSTFAKLTTEVKEVSKSTIVTATQFSHIHGFDLTDLVLEEKCELKDPVSCVRTGDEGSPKLSFEFQECYVNSKSDEKVESKQGIYTLRDGQSIHAVREKRTVTGSIFCKDLSGENKSLGNGTIVTERYLSPDIVSLPSEEVICSNTLFFYAKTVVLDSGKKIEYVRNETLETPLRNGDTK